MNRTAASGWMENQIQPGLSLSDCESAPDASDFHSIFYGHHMKDGSRFSELIRLKDEDFFQKHRTAYLYFPDGKKADTPSGL